MRIVGWIDDASHAVVEDSVGRRLAVRPTDAVADQIPALLGDRPALGYEFPYTRGAQATDGWRLLSIDRSGPAPVFHALAADGRPARLIVPSTVTANLPRVAGSPELSDRELWKLAGIDAGRMEREPFDVRLPDVLPNTERARLAYFMGEVVAFPMRHARSVEHRGIHLVAEGSDASTLHDADIAQRALEGLTDSVVRRTKELYLLDAASPAPAAPGWSQRGLSQPGSGTTLLYERGRRLADARDGARVVVHEALHNAGTRTGGPDDPARWRVAMDSDAARLAELRAAGATSPLPTGTALHKDLGPWATTYAEHSGTVAEDFADGGAWAVDALRHGSIARMPDGRAVDALEAIPGRISELERQFPGFTQTARAATPIDARRGRP